LNTNACSLGVPILNSSLETVVALNVSLYTNVLSTYDSFTNTPKSSQSALKRTHDVYSFEVVLYTFTKLSSTASGNCTSNSVDIVTGFVEAVA